MKYKIVILCLILMVGISCRETHEAGTSSGPEEFEPFLQPRIPFAPQYYTCCKALKKIKIDGKLDEPSWLQADWTSDFQDIEGSLKPAPPLRTRAKMLWDEEYFYIGAELEEPHIWANLMQRDSIIFFDNDFEVFIDPDGDTHRYYELEINAYGTEWDLFLDRPYRDEGQALHSWDIQGLRTGVHIMGTINNPDDRDSGWSVEIAFPWKVLQECAPGGEPPSAGHVWRINFSRVEWQTEVVNGRYVKVEDPNTGKPLPENNWVWSPQGLINMHYPEMWGYVLFSGISGGRRGESIEPKREERAKWMLRSVYYHERNFFNKTGYFTQDLSLLNLDVPEETFGYVWPPQIQMTKDQFQAILKSEDGRETWNIDQQGRVWRDEGNN
ncbi:carbohydrate-binding family 9-like protein [Acidobacteriota bacterium]